MEHMRRETILIIDDDAINRAILEQISAPITMCFRRKTAKLAWR